MKRLKKRDDLFTFLHVLTVNFALHLHHINLDLLQTLITMW